MFDQDYLLEIKNKPKPNQNKKMHKQRNKKTPRNQPTNQTQILQTTQFLSSCSCAEYPLFHSLEILYSNLKFLHGHAIILYGSFLVLLFGFFNMVINFHGTGVTCICIPLQLAEISRVISSLKWVHLNYDFFIFFSSRSEHSLSHLHSWHIFMFMEHTHWGADGVFNSSYLC